MKTVYDWICLGIFAGLVVLFLQRSTDSQHERDAPLAYYLIAGAASGVANYLGNNGQDLFAILAIVAALVFIMRYLKPFHSNARP